MLINHLLKTLILIAVFLLTLNSCSNDTIKVEKGQLKKDLIRAELIAPDQYIISDKNIKTAKKLAINNSEVWQLEPTDLKIILRLTNQTNNTIHFAHPSDCYYLDIDTKGTGIRSIWAPNSIHFSGPSIGTPRQIKPNASYDIIIDKLGLSQRIADWKGFVTSVGTAQLRGSIKAHCIGEGMDPIYARSDWEPVKIIEK